jgi:uncharacterized protein
MFDAAQAALAAVAPSLNPATARTHGGLIAAFSAHVVKGGPLPADLGRSLNQVERIRLLADYAGEAIDEPKVRCSVDQANSFLRSARERGNAMPKRSDKVPKAMAETYAAVTALSDACSREPEWRIRPIDPMRRGGPVPQAALTPRQGDAAQLGRGVTHRTTG